MKAYWIQANEQKITEVEVATSGDLAKLLQGTPAQAEELANRDCLFVDHQGVLKKPQNFFLLKGGDQVFAGNGVVLGRVENSTDACDVYTPLSEVTSLVHFCNVSQLLHPPGQA